MSFLDNTGLQYFWSKIRGIIGSGTLNTTNKTISPAINELNSGLTTVTQTTLNAEKVKGVCYRVGRICMLTINNGADGVSAANTILATLPQGFRPIYQAEFVDTYGKIRMRITDDGNIANVEQANTFIRGTCVFIAQ